MLALRLRGSRSICTNRSGPSCRIHGRGRPFALARHYASDNSKKPDGEAAAENAQGQTSSRRKKKKESGKDDTDGKNKPASAKDKTDATPSEPSSSNKKLAKDQPETENTQDDPEADNLKIIRDSMALLRKFQVDPAKFAEHTKPDAPRSLKTHFQPIQGASKYDARQSKVLIETMSILKDALQLHVKATTGKDKPAKGADKDVTKAAQSAIASAKSTLDKAHAQSAGKPEETEKAESKTEKAQAKSIGKADKKTASAKLKQQSEKAKTEPEPKEESRQKAGSEEGAKKKNRAEVRSRSKAKAERQKTSEVATSKKKTSEPKLSDAVSASLASVVANARARPKTRKSGPDLLSDFVEEGDGLEKSHKAGRKRKHDLNLATFRADPATAMTPIDGQTIAVPLIQYGLDRVLFKEGVYPLQDPRTRVWNFDPYLASIMPVSEFDFEALKEYITSSKDQKLIGIAKGQGTRYTGSTSSMTSTLAHFHFLLSQWRPLNHARLTKGFEVESENYSSIMRAPSATFLNYKDGVYAIDADKEWDDETILTMLGHSMEKLMTVPKEEFERFHRSRSHELTEEEKGQDQSYHYTTYGDFMMRSQLDAYDPRLPGTGVYDLKTRAVVTVRMDAVNHEMGVGYEIRQRDGNWESFEREYYDLIRSAFLKYSLQVRMGRMDGIFVAYHNTERIFGFQYIPLEEMDLALHGTMDKTLGDKEFTASLKLFNDLLNRATAKFPERSLRVHVEARTSDAVPFLYFFAEPVTDEQIKKVQNKKEGAVEAFRKRLGIVQKSDVDAEVEPVVEAADAVEEATADVEEALTPEKVEAEVQEDDSQEIWEDMMNVVEDTMNKDAEGITAIRDAIQEALEQSGLLRAKSSEEAERYVEALLKSIVNPDAELTRAEDESSSEPEASDDKKTDSAEAEPPAPKKSTFGSLFSWFSPATEEAKSPKEVEPEVTQETLPADVAETKDTTEEADDGPSPELVDLLLKLTSRVGSTTNQGKRLAGKAEQQELSEDQAKIQSFERILAEMMPKVVESTEAEAEAEAAEGEEDFDERNTSAAERGDSGATGDSDLLAMVVTIRNKVNKKDVQRPVNLSRSDEWDIEYAVEEIKDERARKLYGKVKSRRKDAHYRAPASQTSQYVNKLKTQLNEYTQAGRSFRKHENETTKGQPVYIVGLHEPLPAEQVFHGTGAQLEHVLPSLTYPRPEPVKPYQYQPPEEASAPARSGQKAKSEVGPLFPKLKNHPESAVSEAEARKLSSWLQSREKGSSEGAKEVEVAETKGGASNEDTIAQSVAEPPKGEESKASSFKEWREKSKQS
ncbi:unnamed protein product [Discula destructiva]